MSSTITDRLNGLTTSVAVKAPVRVATTGAITLSGLPVVDGVAIAAGDRVLVKDQADARENGIYAAASGRWPRTADFDGSLDAVGGTQVFVIAGYANGESYWRTAGDGVKMPGSDNLTFEAISGPLTFASDLASSAPGKGAGLIGYSEEEYPAGTVGYSLKNPNFIGSFLFQDLGADVPDPGVYLGRGGNALSFQTLISNPSGGADSDNQRASLLVVSETTDDGNSEEQTLCLLTTIATGYTSTWAQSTAYAVGDNIRFGLPTNAVYRCTQAGTSAASGSGPSGVGTNIVDGTARWMWINDGAIDAKVGFYNEVIAKPGGGNGWAQANNFELELGYNGSFAVNTELDFTNRSGADVTFGGTVNRYNLYMVTDGDKNTAALELTSRNTDNFAALWAIHITGDKHAERAMICVDGDSAIGLGFGASGGGVFNPTFATASIVDGATAPLSYKAAGTYSSAAIEISGTAPAALNLSGTFSGWLIYSPDFQVLPTGSVKARTLELVLGSVGNYANDAAAAAGGIGIGGTYRNGSVMMIRAV